MSSEAELAYMSSTVFICRTRSILLAYGHSASQSTHPAKHPSKSNAIPHISGTNCTGKVAFRI
eukprot:3778079-Rhodomonas_salina.3